MKKEKLDSEILKQACEELRYKLDDNNRLPHKGTMAYIYIIERYDKILKENGLEKKWKWVSNKVDYSKQ